MVKKISKSQEEELTKIQSLIETENESLDLHVIDYLNPASQKMISHIDDKAKYLRKYANALEDLTDDDIALGLLSGLIDEIRDIKLELRRNLQGSLSDSDPQLDPRKQIEQLAKVTNLRFMDLIERLQRIQRILNTTYMNFLESMN